MPLYEYRCQACGKPFSQRRTIDQRDVGLVCPLCSATDIVRLLSSFAAFSQGADSSVQSLGASSCGGCSSTSCAGCGSAHNN